MIPVKLSIKGLYSYQEQQVIDFTPLMDGQIFGIFGPVGSGKSSILDAITYALYGETERLNQRDNRNYNMMNLQSREMEIDFEFRNFEGRHFRFLVQVKRYGSDFDKVYSPERRAFEKESGEWIPLDMTTADPIIGMSYENFRRTIIIPQGKFQEFLQLGTSDRTRMMREIFQLEKYELAAQVKVLKTENDLKKEGLLNRLDQLSEVTESTVAEKEQAIARTQKDVEAKKKQLEKVEKEFSTQQKAKEISSGLDQKKEALRDLGTKAKQFDDLRDRIERYEAAERNFKGIIEKKKTLTRELKEAQASQSGERHLLTGTEEQLNRLKARKGELDKFLETRDERVQKARDLQNWNKIIEAEKESAGLQQRLEKSRRVISGEKEDLDSLKEDGKKITKELSTKRNSVPGQSVISGLQDWFHQSAVIEKNLSETRERLADIPQKIRQKEEAVKDKLTTAGRWEAYQKSKQARQTPDQILDAWRSALEKERDALQASISRLEVDAKLGQWRDQLEEGKPCPLCGAKHHPDIIHLEKMDDVVEQKKQELGEIKKRITQINALASPLLLLEQEITFLREQVTELERMENKLKQSLRAHKEAYSWPDILPPDINAWNALRRKIGETEKDIEVLEKAQTKNQRDLEQKQKDLERYIKASQEIQDQINNLNTIIETRSSELVALREKSNLDQTTSLVEQAAQILTEVKENEKKSAEIRVRLDEASQKLVASRTKVEELQKQILKTQEKLELAERELANKLGSSIFNNEDEIGIVLSKPLDTGKARKQLQDFEQKSAFLEKEIETLQAQLTETPYVETIYRNLEKKLEQVREEIASEQEALIKLKVAWKQESEQLKEKGKLKKDLAKAESRAADIDVLRKLFKSSGFVHYISSAYLKNLCRAANARFRHLTRNQFSLELSEKGDFVIRDYLNDGRLRSVKTLSGGQTFQASLSLALALAESVQHQHHSKQHFFFLDEGFGALDKNSLEIVFDTLKSLRKEQRIVGVISHVEDLQQEIDVFIQINNDPQAGSILTPSWKK